MSEFRPPQPGPRPTFFDQLAMGTASLIVVVCWAIICLFPGYWHAECPGDVWGQLTDPRQDISKRWYGNSPALPFADLYHQLFYPLHNAAMKNRMDKLTELLQSPRGLNALDFAGMTPLHYALVFKRPAAVKTLLQGGVNPEIRDPKSQSPLWYALQIGNQAIISDLLAAGAKLDALHINRVTPLHLLIQRGHPGITAIAITAGVNLDLADSNGKRPIDYAIAADNLALVIDLACAGAAATFSETPRSPTIRLYLGLCAQLGDAKGAAAMLAEHNHLVENMHRWNWPLAELPVDSSPPPSQR